MRMVANAKMNDVTAARAVGIDVENSPITMPNIDAYLVKLRYHYDEADAGAMDENKCEMYDSTTVGECRCTVHSEPLPCNGYCWHNDALDMRQIINKLHFKMETDILCRIENGQLTKELCEKRVDKYAAVMNAIYDFMYCDHE